MPVPDQTGSTLEIYPSARSKTSGGATELTLLTPIKLGPIPGEQRSYEEKLRFELISIQRRADRGLSTPISLTPTIHFARWLILRPEHYLQGACFPTDKPPVLDPYWLVGQNPTHDYRFRSWLFFTSNFDGDLKAYLREFSVFLGQDVDRVWGNCEGYPDEGSRDFEAYWHYAKRYQITTHTFYNAYPGLTVPQVYRLRLFKARFDAFVRMSRGADGRSVADVAELLDRFILENQHYSADFPAASGVFDLSQAARAAEDDKP